MITFNQEELFNLLKIPVDHPELKQYQAAVIFSQTAAITLLAREQRRLYGDRKRIISQAISGNYAMLLKVIDMNGIGLISELIMTVFQNLIHFISAREELPGDNQRLLIGHDEILWAIKKWLRALFHLEENAARIAKDCGTFPEDTRLLIQLSYYLGLATLKTDTHLDLVRNLIPDQVDTGTIQMSLN